MLQIHTDNVWVVPLSGDDRVPVLTTSRLRNVCEGCYSIVYASALEQVFFEPESA
jgi:hypothetical protein